MNIFFRAIILFALLISAAWNEEMRKIARGRSVTTREPKGGRTK